MAELKFGDLFPECSDSIIEEADDGSLSHVISNTLMELRHLGILTVGDIARKLDVPVVDVVRTILEEQNETPFRRERPPEQSA